MSPCKNLLLAASVLCLWSCGRGFSFGGPRRFSNVVSAGRFRGGNSNGRPFGRVQVGKRGGGLLSVGGLDSTGFLKIAEAPPKTVAARQHGKAILECSASGNPAPQITWLKDGQPIFKEHPASYGEFLSGELSSDSIGETHSRVELDCIGEEDAGVYECVADNQRGKTDSVATALQVTSFPSNGCSRLRSSPELSIVQWVSTYLGPIGSDAHLICRPNQVNAAVSWEGPHGQTFHGDNGKYRVLDNGDLLIYGLTFDDMGMFKCSASGDGGAEVTAETFVYPHAKEEADAA